MNHLKKNDVAALFRAIRNHDLTTVQSMVNSDRSFVSARAVAPPKKDDGQSPLQVALKTGSFEIAEFLLSAGADVNYIEQSSVNEWRAPALHDAIRASVFTAGYAKGKPSPEHDHAMRVLKRMLGMGANPNSLDSYGNNCLLRALMDIRQFLSSDPGFPESVSNVELNRAFQQIVVILIHAGADKYAYNEKRKSAIAFSYEPALSRLLTL